MWVLGILGRGVPYSPDGWVSSSAVSQRAGGPVRACSPRRRASLGRHVNPPRSLLGVLFTQTAPPPEYPPPNERVVGFPGVTAAPPPTTPNLPDPSMTC